MIIVIIIAVMTLYIVSLTRDKETQLSVSRSIVEIKNWQEVAMKYFFNNKKWPTNFAVLATSNYFPKAMQCSPWPSSTTSNPECPNKALYQGTNNRTYYTISVQTPSSHIAKQIAAKLPQSEVSGTIVRSSVALPGYFKGGITSAGIVNHNDPVYMPLCPEGFEGHMIEAAQYYTTGYDTHPASGNGFNLELGYAVMGNSSIKAVYSINSSSPYVYAYTFVHSPDTDAKSWAYYITFCLPSKKWYPKLGIWYGAESNQCSNDWLRYNTPFGAPCP